MHNIITVIKKELVRFFTDKRMLVTTIILPGLMIYLLYTFMGSAMSSLLGGSSEENAKAYTVNLPASVAHILEDSGYVVDVQAVPLSEAEGIKEDITGSKADLLLVFPEDFDQQVAVYDVTAPDSGEAPNVEIYYNSTSSKSSALYNHCVAYLDAYEISMSNKFDINRDNTAPDLASDEDFMGSLMASMLPLLLIVFLFSGCMAIAPESIAGEKERGTIATLLVTPMKRSQLAIGKIVSLGIIALCSGISSFIGIYFSMPNLMNFAPDESLNINIYSPMDYVLLVLVILSTVLLLITLISIISTSAKSVKEANTAVMPLMIIVMLVGVTSMFGGGAPSDIALYFIPVYNSVQAMSAIFSGQYDIVNIIVTMISNVLYTAAGAWVLTKMFNSEKVMFAK